MTRFLIILFVNLYVLNSTTASCPKNEVRSKCVQAVCRAQNCTQKGSPIACPVIAKRSCKKGCVCARGFLRDDSGKCIPENKCPVVCPTNMEYSNCTQAICRQLTCSQKEQRLYCPAVVEGSCQSGCVCKSGYLKTVNDTCVPEDQCNVPTCGENEFYSECSNGCDPINCPKSLKEEQERLATCVAPAVCLPPECRCLRNFRRDENGKCIYIGKCPGICPACEEFSNCTQALCRAQNCSQLGQSIACPVVEEGSCQLGCVCKKGALRDKDENCVPEKQCKNKQCN